MRYLKKFTAILIIAILALNISGCETLKKKFIRKKKAGKKTAVVLSPQNYKGVYSNEVLYSNHFTYWRTWTEDLMSCLSDKSSNKRQILSAARAIEDLQMMRELLKSPKKESIDPYIKTYEHVLKVVGTGQPSDASAASMLHDLESRRRVIIREFEPKKVKGFILQEGESVQDAPIQTIEQTLPEEETKKTEQ